LTDVAGGVSFDLDGDGVLERVAWTSANSDEAFLWRDLNGNGIVDSGRELFGEAMAANGFEALRVGDLVSDGDVVSGGDGNGVLNAGDRLWSELRLWIDRDHNGICTPDEVESLASAGIVELDLSYTASGRKDRAGNEFRFVSKMTRLSPGGKTRQSKFYDVYLGVE
jgi:hypothetical protein